MLPRKPLTTRLVPVDSDLFASCGLVLQSSVYSDGDYSLSRVDYRGRQLIAEVSPAGGVFQHRWPSVRGILSPVSSRDIPGGKRLLLFDPGEGRLLIEILGVIGGLSEIRGLSISSRILEMVIDLQAAGMICGYLGPEMFLLKGQSVLLLAGRRGVPQSPFTPPEVGSARPSDPRSDVFALGSLFFRLIAGSDSRDAQLRIWNKLEPEVQKAVQSMVSPDPLDRPVSLRAVGESFERLKASLQNPQPEPESKPVSSSDNFVKPLSDKSEKSSGRKYLYIAVPLVLILAYLVFRFSAPPRIEEQEAEPVSATDSVVWEDEQETVSPWADVPSANEPAEAETDSVQAGVEDSAVLWISNCSGVEGLENQFRAGAASGYSFVYPLTGTTRRQTSVALVRRESPETDSELLWQAASDLADSNWAIKPVDMTIMLGTDLSYAGLNSGFLQTPQASACTLFVDVVNHGIQYSLEGLGAATWVAGALEGKAFTWEGTEYLIAVSDIRDADSYNEEIGIPEVLDTTIVLYKGSSEASAELERLLRRYFQALPAASPDRFSNVQPPDIHLLIGSAD